MESFASKWFLLYYSVLGFCLISAGGYLVMKKEKVAKFLLEASNQEKPPRLFIRILKYILFFTLPGLILSFFPFSWIEFLFTIWSLLLVYIGGLQLVHWDQNRLLIKANTEKLPEIIKRSGAIMVAVGFSILLLTYSVLNNTPL